MEAANCLVKTLDGAEQSESPSEICKAGDCAHDRCARLRSPGWDSARLELSGPPGAPLEASKQIGFQPIKSDKHDLSV